VEAPETHYARNGGVSLAYQVVGDGGPDILYIPGYLSNVELSWDHPRYAGFLRRVASLGRLILMDRRGTGCSDRFSPEDLPALETMMEDVRVVLDAVGSVRTVLFSFEMGGALASMFAATYPNRTIALVLYGWNPSGIRTPDYEWQWGEAEWEKYFADVADNWGTDRYVKNFAEWVAPSIVGEAHTLRWWARFLRLSASPGTAISMERLYTMTDLRNVLPTIHVPTLVLHRVGDPVEPIGAARYTSAHIEGAKLVELDGNDAPPWAGDYDSLVAEIEEFVTGTRHATEHERVLTTVMFTDIVGSTERATQLGDRAWNDLLGDHNTRVREELERFGGREIDTAGDGFLATFDGPARAVRCALAISRSVHEIGVETRAGVHTGEVDLVAEGVRGIAVHIGARVAALASGGEVLVSRTVRDLVAGSGLDFEDAGEHELRGIPDLWQLYRVVS
jgi:class 3 adenylate cyclase